jgi:hypothetical protein
MRAYCGTALRPAAVPCAEAARAATARRNPRPVATVPHYRQGGRTLESWAPAYHRIANIGDSSIGRHGERGPSDVGDIGRLRHLHHADACRGRAETCPCLQRQEGKQHNHQQ